MYIGMLIVATNNLNNIVITRMENDIRDLLNYKIFQKITKQKNCIHQ